MGGDNFYELTLIEYIWIGGNNELRSKTKVISKMINTIHEIPDWNFDGSSTSQADGCDSEIIIKPKAMFDDPFRGGHHKLVLCDTYTPNDEPLFNNNRVWAEKIFNQKLNEEPWFGLEQEYFLFEKLSDTIPRPFGFIGNKKPGQYYCGVGANNTFGRSISELHLNYCIYAGIKISGINAEVEPGQWEFQIGPCIGIEEGDHLWVARYILQRIGEMKDVVVNFEPKPIKGNCNGSGCHINYSTKKMREGDEANSGIEYIHSAIEKLSFKHKEHMQIYGTGNEERMTGTHETASYDTFSHGIANRGASIRIGNENYKNGKGYFEDRRPSSNCDPYLATAIIFKTTCLDS